jgi:hypothetical protein
MQFTIPNEGFLAQEPCREEADRFLLLHEMQARSDIHKLWLVPNADSCPAFTVRAIKERSPLLFDRAREPASSLHKTDQV